MKLIIAFDSDFDAEIATMMMMMMMTVVDCIVALSVLYVGSISSSMKFCLTTKTQGRVTIGYAVYR